MSVFISGATGFIAQHIVGQLLEQDYKVIASARNETKANELSKNFNNSNLTVVVTGDISKLDAFDSAFKQYGSEIKYVIHAASPVLFEVESTEKDILIPAVNGTKGILESIKKYAANTVERIVMTSSVAALSTYPESLDPKAVANEDSWNTYTWESAQISGGNAYFGSKKFAERYLWDFLEENKDNLKIKATTVMPVFVFGPQMFDSSVKPKLNLSCEVINSLIHTPIDGEISPMLGKFIHVKDVAKAHVLAMQRDDLIGKRLIVSEDNFNSQDILNYLNEDFPVLKGKIPVGNPDQSAEGKPSKDITYDNSRSRELLGFKFRSLKEAIDDTAAQVLKHEGRI
ncbi:similar to Saccharomyces cerevisiae YOL151W GRE2 3-methylbutanal reductase and NADPH-dependent methylglyoxal reductase (D-lactaldehyde dehydrogenase) [Maudiozyma saulgeensis]|uniref:Similar to Saccharomyces cerevisiae YOL151W GRE2 3-methylbutanal reductase and NADPH-dependent methylglyoxal reductase (D-lactaldehyde dehydrogenase) n=1 Tax=Maudiozyma saulgeensis TaxID=1789683 RepID=A0A1X7R419_9SACH|nr:similar to Saccharomyces cerevisiae YOL151W GRE2 3-methylbutanal reductase and NADPH-dependent methylglyoxal reductase (D-lactaldehyde dehydrogenase) [Kazachstania saulgeensis]